MFWFKSRPQQRRITKKQMRFEVEELERKLPCGSFWEIGDPIDIWGVLWGAVDIYVAGQTATFSILGSGRDWDIRHDEGVPAGGEVEDAVTINWYSGALGSLTGTEVSFTLASAAEYTFQMIADDNGALPTGDEGSRDDAPVTASATKIAIWVSISLNVGPGAPQGVYPADGGFTSAGFADNNLGFVTFGYNAPGLYWKVELTGDVAPHVDSIRNGLGRFDWHQTFDSRLCVRKLDGTTLGVGRTGPDDPEEGFQTHTTVDWKIFMIDAPGQPRQSMEGLKDKFVYRSYTTWVTFTGNNGIAVRASDDYKWSLNYYIKNDGHEWDTDSPREIAIGPGHDPNRPGVVGPIPGQPGFYDLDCSTQLWP